MTKQEEIRERIAELFKIARQEGALTKWADGKADADNTLAYLDSMGGCLKVKERELPKDILEKADNVTAAASDDLTKGKISYEKYAKIVDATFDKAQNELEFIAIETTESLLS